MNKISVDDMSERIQLPKYMLTVIPIISMLIGVGITYGVTTTQVSYLERRTDILELKVDKLSLMAKDIEWIKEAIQRGEQ